MIVWEAVDGLSVKRKTMIDFARLHSFVQGLPIVDWHNHLDINMLAEDRPLGSLYEVWVKSDPYKHRAMRICGEPELLITGDAPEDEKWAAWMRTLPKLVGNPLFAWARMELEWLGADPEPYLHGRGENISVAGWTPSKMLAKFGVEYMSPCVGAGEFSTGLTALKEPCSLPPGSTHLVDPANPVKNERRGPVVVPSLRMNAGDVVPEETLGKFHAAGCRVVDISVDDVGQFSTSNSQLSAVAAFAAAHGWTMLLHLGALRDTSARLRAAAGPVGGFAGMRMPVDPAAIAAFLNGLEGSPLSPREARTSLPRTVLMSLNPEAHAQLAVLSGSFVGDGVPGKVQLGPAWWWCDHEDGIRDVLEKNAAYGVLSAFVGMTTDSRSLLSFVRHDYFRRVLCRWVAEKVASGAFPDDEELLRPMLENVCYRNAKRMVSREEPS